MPRLYDRYPGFAHGHTQPARTCSTPNCSGTAKGITTRCSRCRHRLSRFGHPLQTLPTTAEMDKAVRRIEEARGSLKLLDLDALEARWDLLLEEARARATPSYKNKGTLSYNGHDREGSQLIQDVGDSISFLRAIDLIGAAYLIQHERGFFRNEEAFACSVVELFRRTGRVGCMVTAQNNVSGAIQTSYRRELSRPSRLAAARMLIVAIGGAAQALAKRAAEKADRVKEAQSAYYATLASIEHAAL
jgi:hypothetical protein